MRVLIAIIAGMGLYLILWIDMRATSLYTSGMDLVALVTFSMALIAQVTICAKKEAMAAKPDLLRSMRSIVIVGLCFGVLLLTARVAIWYATT